MNNEYQYTRAWKINRVLSFPPFLTSVWIMNRSQKQGVILDMCNIQFPWVRTIECLYNSRMGVLLQYPIKIVLQFALFLSKCKDINVPKGKFMLDILTSFLF